MIGTTNVDSYHLKMLDIATGEYNALAEISRSGVMGDWHSLNACGMNPIDSIFYCVVNPKGFTGCSSKTDSSGCKHLLIRLGIEGWVTGPGAQLHVEYVALLSSTRYTYSADFTNSGDFIAYFYEGRLLRFENVAALPGFRAEWSTAGQSDADRDTILANVADLTRGSAFVNRVAGADLVLADMDLKQLGQPQTYLFTLPSRDELRIWQVPERHCGVKSGVSASRLAGLTALSDDCGGTCSPAGATCCTHDTSTGRPLK